MSESQEHKREVVIVGWDGASNPIRRYRDELHLHEHMQQSVEPEPHINNEGYAIWGNEGNEVEH